ncbi:hypothetical protein BGX30_005973 [Mortierella sp. GBA39]|nr:hypothetical protein BGX30_005973 [Mortierella sp. GBA39]
MPRRQGRDMRPRVRNKRPCLAVGNLLSAGLQEAKAKLEPLSDEVKHVKKQVLEILVKVLRICADAYNVSDKTRAEDLAQLKKANLSGLFVLWWCLRCEKQILQKGYKISNEHLEELQK